VIDLDRKKLAIFDFGNVLVKLDWKAMFKSWSESSGVPPLTLESRFSFEENYKHYERAEISTEDYYAAACKLFGMEVTFAQFLQGWNAIFAEEISETIDVLPRLKQHLRLVVFSNTNSSHLEFWTKKYTSMLEHFETLYASSTLGMRKPEPGGFLHILKEQEATPAETIFFDDLPSNVEAARALGIESVLVDKDDAVCRALSFAS
jgi:glucose-1-phosphatase